MKSGSRMNRDVAGLSHAVEGSQLAGFEDHLEPGRSAGFFDLGDFIKDIVVVAREESSPGNHHVDFVGALGDSSLCFLQFSTEGPLSRGKRRGNRSHS